MKKKLIIVLICIAAIFTLFVVNAETEEKVTLDKSFFSNKKVFCVEVSQDFAAGTYTKKTVTEYTADSSLDEFQSGLGHILSYNWTGTRKTETYGGVTHYLTGNDPIQLALWAYLADYEGEAQDFFGDEDLNTSIFKGATQRLYINDSAGTIKERDKWIGDPSNVVSFDPSTEAYVLYKQAITARTEKNKYEFDIDYYYKSVNQTAIKVNTVEEDDTVEVELTFKKEDFGKNALGGAKITIENVTNGNVDSISTTSLESAGTDGSFGTITVKPIDKKEPFTIKVKETKAPTDYNKIEEIELTVNYKESDGSVTSITADPDLENFAYSGSTITLKDDSRVVDLDYTLVKTDMAGNPKGGAEFKLEFTNTDYVYVNGSKKTANTVTGLMTDGNGKIDINKIVAEEGKTSVKMKITETNPPSGYVAVTSSLELIWNYDEASHSWKLEDPSEPENWAVDQSTATITIKNRPAIKLEFEKQNFAGDKLVGAEIKVTDYEVGNIESITGTNDGVLIDNDNDGRFEPITIYPSSYSGKFCILLEEKQSPTDYDKLSWGELGLILKVEYDTTTGEIKNITSQSDELNEYFELSEDKVLITLKNDSKVVDDLDYIIKKTDTIKSEKNPVENAVFELEFDNIDYVVIEDNSGERTYTADSDGKKTIEGLKTTATGEIVIKKIVAKGVFMNGEVTMNATETEPAVGYSKADGYANIKWKFDTTEHDWKLESSNKFGPWDVNTESATISVENKHAFDLVIDKIDSLTDAPLEGARFKIELTNVESMKNYETAHVGSGETQNPPTIVYVKTNIDGKIVLTEVVPKVDADGVPLEVKATIKEVEVPTATGYYYKLLEEPIEITIKYNSDAKKWEVIENEDVTDAASASVSGHTVTVEIKNQPYIRLEGMVWEDGQTGEKVVAGPNGIIDSSEEGIEGIIVELYNIKTGEVISIATTNSTGNYSFEDIERTYEGYRVIFKYNGITHIETPEGTVSKAEEIDRIGFNNRFEIIEKDRSNDGTTLTYTYNSTEKTSTLNSTIQGHTTGTTDGAFQISAQAGDYIYSSTEVHCGLAQKEFDLAIGTDVKQATLTINDKQTTYNYAQIMNGELEDLDLDSILQNNSSSREDIKYNLYLYTSDYYYRISDYKVGNDTIVNKVNPGDNGVNNYDGLNESKQLKVYVDYSVILKNQTTKKAAVEEFVYYYDSIYAPILNVGDKISGYEVTAITDNKIIFKNVGLGNSLEEGSDYRKTIDLTFELDINSEAYINLVTTVREAKNVAEITKYSTSEGGLIDRDSAPGNANVTFTNGTPKVGQYEDDTDEAKGIKISVRENEARTITGTVFDDTYKNGVDGDYDKDGSFNNSNNVVNDVIVQLIEIKQIEDNYYEYIWQETRSGRNTVKRLKEDGTTIEEVQYRESEPLDGTYEFIDFIPGNYIIRFIYGDGTTYDLTEDVRKYNGQDYKSTIDPNYKKAWYNTSNYSEGASVARDNEARRLEVMAYSTTIDADKGKALERREENDLKQTWMAAETSRINVPIDADNKETESDLTTASYDYTSNDKMVLFGDMNFGLALRPQTKLELEKHITALKIVPNGDGALPITDQSVAIEDILGNPNITLGEGVHDGLKVIKSTRDERGFWSVEIELEKLAQGSNLEVTYTYVITNNSDEDYLSSTLVNAYKDKEINPYEEVLLEIKDTVRGTMRVGTYAYVNNPVIGTYLGENYYKGTPGSNDEEVISRVEELQEALNKEMSFDNKGKDFVIDNTDPVTGYVFTTNKELIPEEIKNIVKTRTASEYLEIGSSDFKKTLTLSKALGSQIDGEVGGNYPSYLAEITEYSNAAGRRNILATPANLSYVHSYDEDMELDNSLIYENGGKTWEIQDDDEDKATILATATNVRKANEVDEFWGESIIITKPTGEDKLTTLQITLITISAAAVIGAGIVLIKKFVLNK